ncbi:MAG: hypothetical protein AVDCRST_MAG93-5342, partial [uncultured Chloroflexia bacterium]
TTQAIDHLFDGFGTSTTSVSDRAPSMIHTLELLTEEIVRRQPGYVDALAGLAQKLLLDTARAVVAPQPPAALVRNVGGSSTVIVQQLVRYLHDNYPRPLAIRDLAAQVSLSERHISRIFAHAMHCTIAEYLTNIRIEAAARRLITERTPIKAVADACGYPDVQHFTTLFRQRIGQTPAAFRRSGGTTFINPGVTTLDDTT